MRTRFPASDPAAFKIPAKAAILHVCRGIVSQLTTSNQVNLRHGRNSSKAPSFCLSPSAIDVSGLFAGQSEVKDGKRKNHVK